MAAGCASSATLPRYQVLNLTSGEVLVVNEASLDGYVYAVCFSPDDAFVLCGLSESEAPGIYVFNGATSGGPLHHLSTGAVSSLSFTPAGLLGVGGDGVGVDLYELHVSSELPGEASVVSLAHVHSVG